MRGVMNARREGCEMEEPDYQIPGVEGRTPELMAQLIT